MSQGSSSKVALVTGTSSGIGLHTAVLLAQAGFTTVATMRDLAKAEALQAQAQAAGVALDVRQLDVQDANSITDCVQGVVASYGRIDVLVNNAGAGFLGTMEQTSEEELRRTMEVNFFGVWRVTQAVLPLMRTVGAGRIITLTSIGGLVGQPFNDAYCAAKFAVEGFMESLAPVAQRLGVFISLIEPGPVNTEFVASVVKTRPVVADEVRTSYQPMLNAYLAGTQEAFATIGQTGEDVGRIIVEAATADAPHFRYVTSEIIRGLVAQKYVDPTGDSIVKMMGARLP